MSTFAIVAHFQNTKSGRRFYRDFVIEAETLEAAKEEAKAKAGTDQDNKFLTIVQTFGPEYFIFLRNNANGKTAYLKSFKGHGKEVHITRVYGGKIDDGPRCGSGTVMYGMGIRREYTGRRFTTQPVTCKKCLKAIAEYGVE